MARFSPQSHHCAGPTHFVNGGILATIIDCHCVCTAAAAAYRDAGRPFGEPPHFFYATAKLEVVYQRPTPLANELTLSAEIESAHDRGYVLSCTVVANDKICVRATVEAVRVPESWMSGEPAA